MKSARIKTKSKECHNYYGVPTIVPIEMCLTIKFNLNDYKINYIRKNRIDCICVIVICGLY